MSRLVVLTRKTLVPGFQLGGVEAIGISTASEVQEWIAARLEEDETLLLAVDHDLYEAMDESFRRRLKAANHIFIVPIPGSHSMDQTGFRQQQMARLIQQAIGVHITFKGEKNE